MKSEEVVGVPMSSAFSAPFTHSCLSNLKPDENADVTCEFRCKVVPKAPTKKASVDLETTKALSSKHGIQSTYLLNLSSLYSILLISPDSSIGKVKDM